MSTVRGIAPVGVGLVFSAGPPRISYRRSLCAGVGWVGSVWGGGCLVVENCTVDASIFCFSVVFLQGLFGMPARACQAVAFIGLWSGWCGWVFVCWLSC